MEQVYSQPEVDRPYEEYSVFFKNAVFYLLQDGCTPTALEELSQSCLALALPSLHVRSQPCRLPNHLLTGCERFMSG